MTFKEWYMNFYWHFDDMFLQSAKLLGITYHEFVLISLTICWPLLTVSLFGWCCYLLGRLKAFQSLKSAQD